MFPRVLARALFISLMAAGTAQASIVFTVTRLSDTTASVVGSGSLEGPAQYSNGDGLVLDNVLTMPSAWSIGQIIDPASTMAFGSSKVESGQSLGSGFSFGVTPNSWLYFSASEGLYVGASPTGTLLLSLNIGSFASVGTTGSVYWGSYMPDARVVGTYSIVDAAADEADVPEPASLAIIGLGLMGIAAGRRRSR